MDVISYNIEKKWHNSQHNVEVKAQHAASYKICEEKA